MDQPHQLMQRLPSYGELVERCENLGSTLVPGQPKYFDHGNNSSLARSTFDTPQYSFQDRQRPEFLQRSPLSNPFGSLIPVAQPHGPTHDHFMYPSKTAAAMPCQALGESAEFAGMEMEPNDGNEYLYLQIKAQVSEMFEKVYAAQNHRSSSGSGSGEDMMLLTPLDLATNSPSTPSHHSFPYSRSRRSSSAAVQPRKEGNKKTTSRRGAKRAGMTKEERAESHALSESVRRDETTLGNEYGFITVEEWFKKLVRGSGWDVYNSTNHSNQRSKNSQLYELVAWLHYLIHERKFPRRSGQVLENKRLALIIIDMFGRRAALVTEMTEVRRETELKERKAKEMGQAAATPADSPRKSSKPKKQAGSRQSHKGSVPREKL